MDITLFTSLLARSILQLQTSWFKQLLTFCLPSLRSQRDHQERPLQHFRPHSCVDVQRSRAEVARRHEEEQKHQNGVVDEEDAFDHRLPTVTATSSIRAHEKGHADNRLLKRTNIFYTKRWHEGQFRAALALIHRTKQLNETHFYHHDNPTICLLMHGQPPRPLQSLTLVCADGPRRPNRCLTSWIPSITQVQTVQLEAGDFYTTFLYHFNSLFTRKHNQRLEKIGSMWIDFK